METHDWPPKSDVMQSLFVEPQKFNFFQAVYLLERLLEEQTHIEKDQGHPLGRLRLKAETSLSFAPSDVSQIKALSNGEVELVTRVMSLAGAMGPLPIPFTEILLQLKHTRGYWAQDFLDIFHNRWLGLLYKNRKKHRVEFHWNQPESTTPISKALRAMGGSKLPRASTNQDPHFELWLKHVGLQNASPRSMINFLTILRHRMNRPVGGEQMIGQWRSINTTDTLALGKSRLGINSTLGRRYWDQMAGIALTIDILDLEDLASFLPGKKLYRFIAHTALTHFQRPHNIKLILNIKPIKPSQIPRLGQTQLGLTCWLSPSTENKSNRFINVQPLVLNIVPSEVI